MNDTARDGSGRVLASAIHPANEERPAFPSRCTVGFRGRVLIGRKSECRKGLISQYRLRPRDVACVSAVKSGQGIRLGKARVRCAVRMASGPLGVFGRLRHLGEAPQEDKASFFQYIRTPGKSSIRTGPLPFPPTEAHRGTASPLPQMASGRVGSRCTFPRAAKHCFHASSCTYLPSNAQANTKSECLLAFVPARGVFRRHCKWWILSNVTSTCMPGNGVGTPLGRMIRVNAQASAARTMSTASTAVCGSRARGIRSIRVEDHQAPIGLKLIFQHKPCRWSWATGLRTGCIHPANSSKARMEASHRAVSRPPPRPFYLKAPPTGSLARGRELQSVVALRLPIWR